MDVQKRRFWKICLVLKVCELMPALLILADFQPIVYLLFHFDETQIMMIAADQEIKITCRFFQKPG